MQIGDAFKGKYLSAGDFDFERTMTVAGVQMVLISSGNDNKPDENKAVMYFQNEDRGLVVNQTNGQNMAAIFGSPDTDHWVGRQITLFSQMVPFGNKMVPGVRVKAPPVAGAVPGMVAPAPPVAQGFQAPLQPAPQPVPPLQPAPLPVAPAVPVAPAPAPGQEPYSEINPPPFTDEGMA